MIRFLKYKYQELKWFIQRGRRGYSDTDLWNFDSYLSKLMIDALSGNYSHWIMRSKQ